ncbi:MAG TPA: hypothetical protein DCZ94_15040 [Lentisphaeria bacterium]|nr:MAG: hypothetical protein A2X48_03195 [Lentisphaerae bacterium GWF2_49_21]HBC88265.1 hypothetical protein [Lentisphaeria bacterium]
MKFEKEIQVKIDESRQLENLSLFVAIYSFAVWHVIFWTSSWMGSDSFHLLLIPYKIIFILSIASYTLGFLSKKAAAEEEDRLLLEKRKEKKALESGEDVLFSAARTLSKYKKFTPYTISILNFIIIGSTLSVFWYLWTKRVDIPVPIKPPQAAFISFGIAVFSLFYGIFCIGQSREKNFRWLRPIGGWLVLSAILGFLATFAIFMHRFDLPVWDSVVKKIIFIITGVLGIELLLNFIVEFYRPRSMIEERPIFESRLLSLFTEPGGVLRNISDTLDYQFGFKVSRTWIYAFFEKSIIPLIIAWLAALWLFTCVCEVGPGEVGIREYFGKIVDVKNPLSEGIYFKFPWPFGKMTRVPVNKIQEAYIGADMQDEKGEVKNPEVVLWTVQHYGKEERYIVASEKKAADKETPVSFISATLALQYRAKADKVFDFAYRNYDIPHMLKTVSEREVSKYLASVDMIKLMSVDMDKAVADLSTKIQESADDMRLGVEIVSLNLLGVHPPVDEVSPAFEEVASSRQEKEASILNAKAYENKTLPYAAAEALQIIRGAETDRDNAIKLAEAEKNRFEKQLKAYKIMPEMYKLRTYLDFFEKDCGDTRKIVVGDSNTNNIYIFNFEEKARMDLLDADLGALSDEVNKKTDGGN